MIRASADALPLADASVDAAIAIISDHHWSIRHDGLREMRRVARRRVILVNSDPSRSDSFWLTRSYLPAFKRLIRRDTARPGWEQELGGILGPLSVEVLPVPHDCQDGFYQAFWRRPEAYLHRSVRDNISVFRRLPPADVDAAVNRLQTDLASGAWAKHHRQLLAMDEADVGLRLVIADLTDAGAPRDAECAAHAGDAVGRPEFERASWPR